MEVARRALNKGNRDPQWETLSTRRPIRDESMHIHSPALLCVFPRCPSPVRPRTRQQGRTGEGQRGNTHALGGVPQTHLGGRVVRALFNARIEQDDVQYTSAMGDIIIDSVSHCGSILGDARFVTKATCTSYIDLHYYWSCA